MSKTFTIFKREFASYFATPVAYVFIAVFLVLAGVSTFQMGRFFENEQANLHAFFQWHPALYQILIPALSMRLWAEERKGGTIELLMTLPVSLWSAVLGKYLAAWAFTAVALFLTFPIVITVNYLGNPDNGTIITAYLGSLFMAGGFLAIGSCVSAVTKNQVIAFVITIVVCGLFVLAGTPMVQGWLQGVVPTIISDTVRSFSFLTHFSAIRRGVIDARDVLFFASLIGCFLFMNAVIVDLKKAD